MSKVKRNERILEAERYGHAPMNNWECPGCGVILKQKQSARRHIKAPCPRFTDFINKLKAVDSVPCTNVPIPLVIDPPQYAMIDLNSLYSLVEKLSCPWCHNTVSVDNNSKNTLAFTLRVHCTRCPFEVVQKSSPLIKVPSQARKQPDIQLRLPTTAQIAGIKYAQLSRFLDLLGVNPPAESSWQHVSDLVFDSVEKVTIKSMQKAQEAAHADEDLWVIVDCRWASRGYNSEQATVLVMDGKHDKVISNLFCYGFLKFCC